jgi:tetratricopeptide (TPR) repeat protein
MIAPALFLLLALSAQDRQRFEKAIERHLASDFEWAQREYAALLAANPAFVPARLYRAQALWLLRRKDEARIELDSSRPASSELLLFRFLERTFGASEDGSALVPKLLRAYPLEQNRFLATGTPSLVLLSIHEVDAAIADYERAAALDPGDATMHRRLGSAFAKSRLWVPAVAAFDRVVAVDPEDASAWRQLGSGNLSLQRWRPAISAFERALDLASGDGNVLLALGYAYERTPDLEAALERYRKASSLAPGWAQPHYRIGRALLASGNLAAAEESFETARSLEPDFPDPLTFLGEIHLKRGETALAIENLERAVALDPELFEAHYHLAQAYRRAGREDDARRSIARYSELKRRQREVLSQEEFLARIREKPERQ